MNKLITQYLIAMLQIILTKSCGSQTFHSIFLCPKLILAILLILQRNKITKKIFQSLSFILGQLENHHKIFQYSSTDTHGETNIEKLSKKKSSGIQRTETYFFTEMFFNQIRNICTFMILARKQVKKIQNECVSVLAQDAQITIFYTEILMRNDVCRLFP